MFVEGDAQGIEARQAWVQEAQRGSSHCMPGDGRQGLGDGGLQIKAGPAVGPPIFGPSHVRLPNHRDMANFKEKKIK
jgi:hypothetical protein